MELLPPEISESLHAIMKENEFDINSTKIEVKNVRSYSDISSSLKVVITEGNRKSLCLFVKYLNQNGESAKNDDSSKEGLIYFKNELIFYKCIQNHFETLSTFLKYCPHCYRTSRTQSDTLFVVMEDLLSEGYKSLDVKEPLSVERARAVMFRLGHYHALSFAFRERQREAFWEATSRMEETVFRREQRGSLGKLFIHAIHDTLKLLKKSLPSNSIYVDKFANFTLNIFDKMADLTQGNNEDIPYKVVTHGDLWLNNILFKVTVDENDMETIENVTFIDYQATRLSSPVHDLMFVLLTSLDRQTREENRDDLIRFYHNSLCQTLKKLDCDPLRLFPFSALEKQLSRHARFAMALALVGLPLFYNDCLIPPRTTTNERPSKKADLQGNRSHLQGNGADLKGNLGGLEGNEDYLNRNQGDFEGNNLNGNRDHLKGNQGDLDRLIEFVEDLRTNKSMRCKNKMLEIVMDAVDQGYLD